MFFPRRCSLRSTRTAWVNTFANVHSTTWRAFSSPREIMRLETEVLDQLRSIKDKVVQRDIVAAGRVKKLCVHMESKRVSFALEAASPALNTHAEQWRRESCDAVQKLSWVKDVSVEIQNVTPRNRSAGLHSSLSNVGSVVAVSSCKGGVGKSTVAVNLAFSLSKLGARVGILDADIYGPSLPTMVSPQHVDVKRSRSVQNFVEPVLYEKVKCMSFGFVNQKAAPGAGGKGAAVMRGPMVSKLIDQLVLGTEWGELDYLIIDMPPGTGDIQMSLSQQVSIAAAVIVTTPQELSLVDVQKGIAMFEDLKIPTAAVVENMSYFDCVHGHRHFPFGSGHLDELLASTQVSNRFSFPIHERLSTDVDKGRPLVLDNVCEEKAAAEIIEKYEKLAKTVAEEVVRIGQKAQEVPEVAYDTKRGVVIRFFYSGRAEEGVVSARRLRARCRCASCIEEFTGKQLLNPEDIPEDIKPTVIQQKGNYAFAFTWSDGHSSTLFTFEQLENIIRS